MARTAAPVVAIAGLETRMAKEVVVGVTTPTSSTASSAVGGASFVVVPGACPPVAAPSLEEGQIGMDAIKLPERYGPPSAPGA